MEKVFIDSNPFIYFLSDIKEKAGKVQEILENGNNEIYTSYAVLNEVKFKLLMNKAIEEHKTNKKYELIKILNEDNDLRTSVIERYLKFFINISQMAKILDMDIITEKLRTVGNRGQKKDFYDLYTGIRELGITPYHRRSFQLLPSQLELFSE